MPVRVRSQITFEANDEAEAFRTARDRLGSEAAILSQRPVKKGGFLGFFRRTVLHVTAGILETDDRREETDGEKKERLAAFQKLLEFKQAMAASESKTSAGDELLSKRDAPASAGVYSPVARRHSEPVQKAIVGDADDRAELSSAGRDLAMDKNSAAEQEYRTRLEREVSELSERLDRVLKRLEIDEKPPSGLPVAPRTAAASGPGHLGVEEAAARMRAHEVSEVHTRSLAQEYQIQSPGVPFKKWLSDRIPVASDDNWEALGGGRVMLIGPTGVGKTTTIAKLAAIHSLFEKRNVVFLTADTYRIAAPEQLRTYAKILCVPMEVIYDAVEVPGILERYEDADLLLLDTAGRSHKDGRRMDELKVLYEHFRPDAVHLVLSANMKYRDMLDVIQRMGVVPIEHVLFTKLDETSTFGALLNIMMDFDRTASFFTTGQNVPNDIEIASGAKLVELLLEKKGEAGRA